HERPSGDRDRGHEAGGPDRRRVALPGRRAPGSAVADVPARGRGGTRARDRGHRAGVLDRGSRDRRDHRRCHGRLERRPPPWSPVPRRQRAHALAADVHALQLGAVRGRHPLLRPRTARGSPTPGLLVVGLSDADAYDRFMGRYSRPLAVPFADFAGLPVDGRVLDVGCGPGALTAELARRVGPERVTAVDPSEEFVAALRGRHPGAQVSRAPAEDLPFERGCFDATLAQLVVNVMADPVAGLREMARVTRDGSVVAACVWDFTDGGPIGPFWDAAQALDPEVETGSVCPGSRAGHLADLFRAAGIGDIVDSAVAVDVEHATFE